MANLPSLPQSIPFGRLSDLLTRPDAHLKTPTEPGMITNRNIQREATNA